MRWLLGALFLAALSASSATARADWQYTRWGMTVDQALKASKGMMKPVPEEKSNIPGVMIRAKGTYQSGDLKFNVGFAFAENKLAGIEMHLTSNQPPSQIIDALVAKYGKPVNIEKHNVIPMVDIWWRGEGEGNYVHYKRIGDGSFVNYTPLSSSRSSGL